MDVFTSPGSSEPTGKSWVLDEAPVSGSGQEEECHLCVLIEKMSFCDGESTVCIGRPQGESWCRVASPQSHAPDVCSSKLRRATRGFMNH